MNDLDGDLCRSAVCCRPSLCQALPRRRRNRKSGPSNPLELREGSGVDLDNTGAESTASEHESYEENTRLQASNRRFDAMEDKAGATERPLPLDAGELTLPTPSERLKSPQEPDAKSRDGASGSVRQRRREFPRHVRQQCWENAGTVPHRHPDRYATAVQLSQRKSEPVIPDVAMVVSSTFSGN